MAGTKSTVLSIIQSLLTSDDLTDPSARTAALASKVTMATTSLLTMPTLHPLALDVICNAFQFHFTQNVLRDSGPLGSSLHHACSTLDSFLTHCPEGWSNKILKWAVDLLGRLSAARNSPPALEDAMKSWLAHPMLASINGFVNKCTDHLVSTGRSQQCIECLFPVGSVQTPWLLAHVLSRHPSSLIPTLLDHTLSSPRPTDDPSFLSLCHILEFLSRSHRDTLKQSVVRVVGEVMVGGVGKRSLWGVRLLALLNLATHIQPLVDIVGSDSLEVVTPSRVCSMVLEGDQATPTEGSYDSHVIKQEEQEEEDEGEIHSDEEEMEEDGEKAKEGEEEGELHAVNLDELVPRLAELVTLLHGPDACTALSHIMTVYRDMKRCQKNLEEAMEEGEILRSPAKLVVEGCEYVMSEVLSNLQTATSCQLTPSQPSNGGSRGVEFAVGLQGGLKGWCHSLVNPEADSVCRCWLQELITCVCVCSSELQASKALSQLLCAGGKKDQALSTVLAIYWEVQVRYPGVAMTTINSALLSIHHSDEETRLHKLESFSNNMLLILNRLLLTDSHSKHIRAQFTKALMEHFLKLLELLLPDSHTVLDMLLSLPPAEELSNSAQCKAAAILLNHFFSVLKRESNFLMENGHADLHLEELLGKYKRLVVRQCKQSHAIRMFVLTTVMETVVSKEMSCYCTFPKLSRVSHLTLSRSQSSLLSTNWQLALTHVPRINTRQVPNTGTLLLRQPKQQSEKLADCVHLCVVHSVDHIMQLLSAVGNGNMADVSSVLIDFAAPHAQPSLTHWPDEESLKYNLEWDLGVKRKFDNHPILWQILLLVSEDPCGMKVCATIGRSLLTVLIRFWQQCRSSKTALCPQELEASITLTECLAKSKWLPPPLMYISELFSEISPNELHLLLNAVYAFLKENFTAIKNGESTFKDTGYGEAITYILTENIHKFGYLYHRYHASH